MMATEGSFDVKMMPDDNHGDGSPNPVAVFHQNFISLSEVIGEMVDKVSTECSYSKTNGTHALT